MRGRKPDNSNVHELAGKVGRRREKVVSIAKPLMDLTPPKRLVGIARETWVRVAPQLVEDQLLTELSVDHLAAYCDAVADYARAREALEKKTDRVGKSPNGNEQQIAEVGIANRALEHMLRLGEIFAIDPYSRERRGKHVPAGGHDEDEGKDSLLSRPTG
jgi:P27 family predicted phage terminase small subunit